MSLKTAIPTPLIESVITFNLNLDIQQPVSNIIWVVQRTDYEKNNQFHNYTNWADKDKEPIFLSAPCINI